MIKYTYIKHTLFQMIFSSKHHLKVPSSWEKYDIIIPLIYVMYELSLDMFLLCGISKTALIW